MCSFELESIIIFLFHYCSILNIFLENYGVHLFQFVHNYSEFYLPISH